jgi:hypothetical protein
MTASDGDARRSTRNHPGATLPPRRPAFRAIGLATRSTLRTSPQSGGAALCGGVPSISCRIGRVTSLLIVRSCAPESGWCVPIGDSAMGLGGPTRWRRWRTCSPGIVELVDGFIIDVSPESDEKLEPAVGVALRNRYDDMEIIRSTAFHVGLLRAAVYHLERAAQFARRCAKLLLELLDALAFGQPFRSCGRGAECRPSSRRCVAATSCSRG